MKSNVFKKTTSSSRDLIVDSLIVNGSSNISGYVDLNSTQTLTNKTISSANNNLTGVVTLTGAQTISGKSIDCATNSILNITNGNVSNTAAIAINKLGNQDVDNTTLSYLNTTTSNIQTQLNSKITNSSTDILINKSIDANNNTITNISDNSISNGISATKIANGSITNTHFQYLSNVTSNIQTQLNTKINSSSVDTLINKSISGTTNNISNISDASLSSGINANKISSGLISNTQFDYLNNVSSNIQTQINTKASLNAVEQLYNKTISATSNTIIDIGNSSISNTANIDCSKLGTGSVSNTQFNSLTGITSNIQSQINNLVSVDTAQSITANKTFETTVNNNNNITIKSVTNNNCSMAFENAFSVNKIRLRKINDYLSFEISNGEKMKLVNDDLYLTNSGRYYINTTDIKDVAEVLTSKTISFANNTLTNVLSTNTNQSISGIKDFSSANNLLVNSEVVYLKRNITTSNPGVNNDSSQGYVIGSQWFNTVTSSRWLLDDDTVGAAKWQNTNRRSIEHQTYNAITLFTNDSYIYFTTNYNYFSKFSVIAFTDGTAQFELFNVSTGSIIATSGIFPTGGPDVITTSFTKVRFPPEYTFRVSVKLLSGTVCSVFATSTE